MKRTFIEVPTFTKRWHGLGLTDGSIRELENVLLDNPKSRGDTAYSGLPQNRDL